MVAEDFHCVHGPGMIDTAFNDHVDFKVVLMEIKELLPVIDIDQFHTVTAPELL